MTGLGHMLSRSTRHDGVDRVDQRHRVRPAVLGRLGGPADVGDVRRQLDDHRHARVLLAPAGDHLDIFRHLADRGAHAAFAHAVRAAEVELDAVGFRVLDLFQDRGPVFFLARHHERDDQGAVLPVALDALDFLEVHLQRPVGDQLDVVKAYELPVLTVDGAVARAVDVDDRVAVAKRFPDDAAPAGLVGADDVVFLVGRWRGGQPERVWRLDANEIGSQINHDGISKRT
jgi:hypothetical protein